VNLRMAIESVKISGHADFNELLQFIKSFKGLRKVFLMHGEKTDLKDYLEKDYEVVIPKLLETYQV
jgi:Cft2 family RNA processing exonuclease